MDTKKTGLIFSTDAEALLRELGIKDLGENEKKEVLGAIIDHFNKVIIETAILNLDGEDLKKFESALRSDNLESEITAICAGVPGLAGKIEEAVEKEFQLIKTAKEMVGEF